MQPINVSSQDNLDMILEGYQYTLYHDNEIVVREESLEEVAKTTHTDLCGSFFRLSRNYH